jgi:3-hydroxyisobutyrate dehydrogenase
MTGNITTDSPSNPPGQPLRVGVLGLGAMGAPMARNLARAGLLCSVWNRTSARSQALLEQLDNAQQVAVAATPGELAAACDVVLTCVSADADLLEVINACLPGLHDGSLVVDMSTVNPATARQVQALVRQRGAALVDAPVSGGVEGARAGTLSVMAGGEADDLARIKPMLDAVAARVTHMGPVGAGQATKAVNQVMVAGINEAVCEALALAEQLGLPAERLVKVLTAGAAGNWFLEKRGLTMLDNQFEPGFKCALLVKDLKICQQLARDLGFDLAMVDATVRDYEQLLAGGFGEADTSALINLKRAAAAKNRS